MADETEIQQPKVTDPLAGIKSSFNLEEFKRVYSTKDPSESLPYFWKNLDKANFSIWRCDYKYNDDYDGKPGFIVANGIGGWFQRLETMRKHAIGSVCIFKGNESGKWIVSGIWILRGQELAFPLCPDWNEDYVLYDWKKLNPDSEEDQKMVNEYLAWEFTSGPQFDSGKIYK